MHHNHILMFVVWNRPQVTESGKKKKKKKKVKEAEAGSDWLNRLLKLTKSG